MEQDEKQEQQHWEGKREGSVEVAGGRPWMGVFVLLRAVGCVGWHLGGTEAGRAGMEMPRIRTVVGWKEWSLLPPLLQWEEASELPEAWVPLHLASSCRVLWGLFAYPFHVSFECPRCCFRLLTPEQTMGVSVLSGCSNYLCTAASYPLFLSLCDWDVRGSDGALRSSF